MQLQLHIVTPPHLFTHPCLIYCATVLRNPIRRLQTYYHILQHRRYKNGFSHHPSPAHIGKQSFKLHCARNEKTKPESTRMTDNTTLLIKPQVAQLFQAIEKALSSTAIGPNRWYLLVLAALCGGTEPLLVDQLYLYLINRPDCTQPAARQALVRRLRESLVKLICIVGVCKPIESILAISKVERPEDRDLSFSREHWKNDEKNHAQAMRWFDKIYARDAERTLALFDAHQDFRWISTEITYGLYLSDRQVLDDLDTEIVVLVGIMIQNLQLETHWHIRGTRRIGVSLEDVKKLVGCVKQVGDFMGTKLDRVPSPDEVEGDV